MLPVPTPSGNCKLMSTILCVLSSSSCSRHPPQPLPSPRPPSGPPASSFLLPPSWELLPLLVILRSWSRRPSGARYYNVVCLSNAMAACLVRLSRARMRFDRKKSGLQHARRRACALASFSCSQRTCTQKVDCSQQVPHRRVICVFLE
eukprot:4076823-Pyramimonas_sp.AAC.1